MASNRGPGAVQADYGHDPPNYGAGHHSASTGTVGGSWGSANGTTNISSSNVIRPSHQQHQQQYATPIVNIQGGGTAVSDGTYEKNLVKELCPPGGLKPVPPPDKLASFARACASLNSDLVCPSLLDFLEDGQPWIIRAKALCAMEAAIANGTKLDGQNSYRDFFFACQDEIAPLASHPRAPIHEPARRVLSLLGVEGAAAAAAAVAAHSVAAAPVAAAPNLLDFDDEPPAPPASQVATPTPVTAATNGGGSMFGGMQVKTAVVAGTAPAPTATAAVPVPPVVPEPSLLDGWGAPSAPANSSSEPAVATTTSMFDQLGVKATGTDMASSGTASLTETGVNHTNMDPLASPTPAASAFGFINHGSPAMNGQPPQPPTFDPLKQEHFSPTSANRKSMSMQMSPEQMQAMAYQQMMMQQQMQQMQRAMAMQAGVVGGMPMFPNIVNPPQRMPSGSGMASPQYSFNAKPAQKDDKKFDFVMDAMKTAGPKK